MTSCESCEDYKPPWQLPRLALSSPGGGGWMESLPPEAGAPWLPAGKGFARLDSRLQGIEVTGLLVWGDGEDCRGLGAASGPEEALLQRALLNLLGVKRAEVLILCLGEKQVK